MPSLITDILFEFLIFYCSSVLVVLVKLSVLAKRLARKASLRMPVCGKITSTKPQFNKIFGHIVFHFVCLCYYLF